MTLRLVFALLIAALFALPACGPLPQGQVPVDSEIKPWEQPDEDELVGEDEDEDDGAGEVEEEDEGDVEEEEPAEAAAG